ncbi:MAG TPA: hypothetical protein PKZ64_08025 [Spirochaetota bacterium]|nr:hypothetical protein [Spirochaetota bacterium]
MIKKNILNLSLSTIILFLSCGEKKDEFRERLNYYNSKYRFRITFPENWINYSSFEIDEIIDPELKVTTVFFALPTRSRDWQPINLPEGYGALFAIRIFTPQQWNRFIEKYSGSKEINNADRKLGENKNSVFMIKNSTSIPVDLYLFMKDVRSITDTFRIVVKE